MVEFFQNVFNWFMINKDKIILFFTSANFASFVTVIGLFIKQLRYDGVNNNTLSSLQETLRQTLQVAQDVGRVSQTCLTLSNDVKSLNSRLDDLDVKYDESFLTISQKLDAILEVQSIVYAGIKDETARKNVANILTSAKLVETATKAEVARKIEELKSLKAEIASKVDDVKAMAEKVTTSEIAEQASEKTQKSTVLRC